MNTELGHEQVIELIPAYVTGGLRGAELAQFEAHLASCAACAAEVEKFRSADQSMEKLFAEIRPDAAFEDRMVDAVRQRSAWRIPMAVRKAAMGVAAAVLLGGMGLAGNYIFGDADVRIRSASNLRAVSPSIEFSALRGELLDGKPATSDIAKALKQRVEPNGVMDLRYSGRTEGKADQAPGSVERWGKVSELTANVKKSIHDRDYIAAQKGVEQILAVDPRNDFGFGVKRLVDDYATVQQERQKTERKDQEAAGEKIPYADIIRYPENWAEISGKSNQPATAAGGSAGPAVAAGGAYYVQNATLEGLAPSPNVDFLVEGKAADGKLASGYVNFGANGTTPPSTASLGYFDFKDFNAPANLKAGTELATGLSHATGIPALGETPVLGRQLAMTGKPVQAGDVAENQKHYAKITELGNGLGAAHGPVALAGAGADRASQPDTGKTPPPRASEPPTPPPQPTPAQQYARKIIRNGEMEFEVDSFDSSFVTITKIVTEQGGYVQSSSSDKLANGKVRGTVVVRVPPDQLDIFVLKLRALGDLKSQKISAQDVTKVYYDLESELKAGRAMEERLLNIIKTGKGEIKDLIEAEKQLGIYREKIEKLEGEIRYYNNLVSLSTMSITLTEKDIRAAAFASQTELVNMGVETEDVEKARTDAIKSIEDAKGRIIESNLKKYDAGQYAASIVCEVAPEQSGPLIDRLRQIGKVARLDIDRKQTAPGEVPAGKDVRVEKKDTRFAISIYNLANIAPRQTTNINLAVPTVEEAYTAIRGIVEKNKGRIVNASLNRQKPEQTTATINFEVPSAAADATLAELRTGREVMMLTMTENPDTQNVTAAKRGFALQVASIASVQPRQLEQITLSTRTAVADTFNKLLTDAQKAGARIMLSQLNDQDRSNVTGTLDVEVMRDKEAEMRDALKGAGLSVIADSINRSADTENTVDSKVRLRVQVISFDRLAPRESQRLNLAAKDVPTAYQALLTSLRDMGARVITSQINEQNRQDINAVLDFDFPTDKQQREMAEKALAAAGVVYGREVMRAPDTQLSVESKLRMSVKLINADQLEPREQSRITIESSEVEKSAASVRDIALKAGGRVSSAQQNTDASGQMSTHMVVDVPLDQADGVRSQIKNLGTVRVAETSTNQQTPDGAVARAKLDVTIANADLIVGRDEGLGASVKKALSLSVKGLLWTLQVLVMGALLVGPWILIGLGGWKVFKRKPAGATPAA